MDKSKHAKYIAALCHMEDGVLVPYESKHIVAANKDDAVQKATEWAIATVEFIAEKTWVQVTLDGVGIYSKVFEMP
jgi:hypothetical protein